MIWTRNTSAKFAGDGPAPAAVRPDFSSSTQVMVRKTAIGSLSPDSDLERRAHPV